MARRSYGKLVAIFAAAMHDVAAAEDALSEAFATALADWPRTGCPANPALLARTHACRDARHAFDIAIGLAGDPAVRRFLQGRQAALPR